MFKQFQQQENMFNQFQQQENMFNKSYNSFLHNDLYGILHNDVYGSYEAFSP